MDSKLYKDGMLTDTVSDYDYNVVRDEALRKNMSLSSFYRKVLFRDNENPNVDVKDEDITYVKDAEYGLGFVPTTAFDLIDRTVHLPLKKYFAQQYVPFRTGGGVAEQIRAFRAQNSPVEMQLAGGQNNSVPVVNGQRQSYTLPVYAWEAGIKVGKVDLMKAERGNYSVIEHYEESLRDSYWYRIEKSAFIGNVGVNENTTATADFVGGLLNMPATKIGGVVEAQIGSLDKALEDMDIEELGDVFGDIIDDQAEAVNYVDDYLINRIILYPSLRRSLVTTPATLGTGAVNGKISVFTSQLDYLQDKLSQLYHPVDFGYLPYLQSDATAKGRAFQVAGTNDLGRVVFYRQSEKAFVFPIPMPLTLTPLMISPTESAYRKNGLAFMGAGILLHYADTIWYLDNTDTQYTVTYNLNGGTNDADNPATFVSGDLPITLDDATKASNTFGGWFTDLGLTNEVETISETGNVTLYAKFTET